MTFWSPERNGAAQAILDAATLARLLKSEPDPVAALKAYEDARLPATSRIVVQNRTAPPNLIVDTVEQRTGGKRFERLDDDRLNETMGADGVCKFIECLFIEVLAWLLRVGNDAIDVDFPKLFGIDCGFRRRRPQQCAQAATQSLSLCHE